MPRATILLAEDDPSVLQAIGDSLTDAGYKVARAASARETLLQLSDATDLLITDLAVFDIDRKGGGMVLNTLAPGVGLDELRAKTEADFKVGAGVR